MSCFSQGNAATSFRLGCRVSECTNFWRLISLVTATVDPSSYHRARNLSEMGNWHGWSSERDASNWAHCITAACVISKVFVADSADNNSKIYSSVAKLLKQLYAARTCDGYLKVNLIVCSQHPNASDCGVFATAFQFEWATASVSSSLDVRFDLAKMRAHLVTCLESERVLRYLVYP